MEKMTYLRLSPNDEHRFRSLLNMFGEVFADQETYCGEQPTSEYIRSLLDSDNYIALVAEERNTVVGGLAAYVLPKFERQRKEIYIYDLAVSSRCRRRGIATELISGLQQIAYEIGAHVIFVQADYGDEPAIALYETFGRKEAVVHFDIAPKNHKSKQ